MTYWLSTVDWNYVLRCSLVGATSVGVGVGSLILLKLARKRPVCPSNERMDNKTVIITGANSGIGKATAQDLLARGAKVIMACRDLGKAEAAAESLRRQTKEGQIVVKKLDLASLESIREFAAEVTATEDRVDVLINNAGVYGFTDTKTMDGFDMQMGVNYLGHFALTLLLLPKLRTASDGPSRVVAVSSSLAKRGAVNLDNLNEFSKKMYSNSKVAVNLFCREFARLVPSSDVCVYSVHPGFVCTQLARHAPVPYIMRPFAMALYRLIGRTPWEGSQPVVYCSVARELTGVSGRYYGHCKEEPWPESSTNDEQARKLWEISEYLTDCKLTEK